MIYHTLVIVDHPQGANLELLNFAMAGGSRGVSHVPIGSMAIYGNMDPINIPHLCKHIYQHHGSVMRSIMEYLVL